MPLIICFLVLYLVPVAAGVSFAPQYAYWLLAGCAIPGLVLYLWSRSVAAQLAALSLNAATTIGNVALASSLYVQGTGFNEQFAFHLDGATFRVAREVFPVLFFGTALIALIVMCWPLLLQRGRPSVLKASIAGVCLVGAACTYAPGLSLGHYLLATTKSDVPAQRVVAPIDVEIEVRKTQDKRNLVLIFAESLESAYSDPARFGENLTPELTALGANGVVFENIKQVPNTGWTIAGLVAGLCGVPIDAELGPNSALANADSPLQGVACAGDILSAYGYRSVFMGGARLAFAGKGNFLRTHGFHEVLGRVALAGLIPDPEYVSGWGLYDDSLFELATAKLEELGGNRDPFALVLLTLDTHHPAGFPSRSCVDAASLVETIRCSDKLITQFVRSVRERYPDTVVAVFSDHLSHRNDVYDTLENGADRHLRFLLFDQRVDPGINHFEGSHFDLLPTLMDSMGIDAYSRHNLGSSLLRGDGGWISARDTEVMHTATAQGLGVSLQLGSTVTCHARGPTLTTGGQTLEVTNAGLKLKNSVFAAVFDEDGQLLRFLENPSYEVLTEDPPAGLIVGVSTSDEFNLHYDSSGASKAICFVGDFQRDRVIARPLWWQESIDVGELETME